jgi:hypothetical protein
VSPEIVIRAPSVDALFDQWDPAPVNRRGLDNDARERIVEQWVEHRRDSDVSALVVLLPEAERADGVDAAVSEGIRADMARMTVDCRRHWIRRSLRGRKSRIGIVLFVVCLLLAAGVNYGATDAWTDTFAQTFVVIAWVALWDPGQSVVDAASNRLARKHYAALAQLDTRVRWDARPAT